MFSAQRTLPATISRLQSSAGFSTEDIGSVFSYFGLSYAFTKLISGLLYDNFHLSPKRLFCVGLLASGVLCLCFPLAASHSVLASCAVWMAMGVFQGLGWPACAHILKQWYQASEMGMMYSIMSLAANIASALIPILSAYLGSYLDWQYTFHFIALSCLLLGAVLIPNLKSSPGVAFQRDNRDTNIPAGLKNGLKNKHNPRSVFLWHSVFHFKEFWLVGTLYTIFWLVKSSVTDWMLLYLTGHMGKPNATGKTMKFVLSNDYALIFSSCKLCCDNGSCWHTREIIIWNYVRFSAQK